MTAKKKKPGLKNIPIMLSASVPEEMKKSFVIQEKLFDFFTIFTRQIVMEGGTIVFGGHPSITPLLRKTAQAAGAGNDTLRLYQLRRFKDSAPVDILDREIFNAIHWTGDASGKIPVADELKSMRDAMVNSSRAAIFLGGKISEYSGEKSGIRDEYERFIRAHPGGPVYLIGFLKGETSNIIREIKDQNQAEANGLSEKERNIIHYDDNLHMIVPLIIEDIIEIINLQ